MSIIQRLAQKLKQGKQTPLGIFQHYLQHIKQYDQVINAFTHIHDTPSLTKQPANQMPFYGIPVALKDNICTTEMPTTCCSRMLRTYMSPFNATVVQRLTQTGFIPIGKTNMDEFAMGSTTTTGIFGATHNPWDTQYSVGGSSGGSAAAVATRMAPIALGSDTGGSVRSPAHFCGVVGMKPTYGTVSRYGLVSYASSLDQIGVFSNCAADIAYVLDIMGGADPHDLTTVPLPRHFFTQTLDKPLAGLSLGIDETLFQSLDGVLQKLLDNALFILQHVGMQVVKIKLPDFSYASSTYYTLASAEAATNLARYDGIRYGGKDIALQNLALEEVYHTVRTQGFGREVRKRLAVGQYCLSGPHYELYFEKAQKYRRYVYQNLHELYQNVDVLFLPTTAWTASAIFIDPTYQADHLLVLANLYGGPAVSFPIGTVNALPFSGQLMSKRFHDHILLNVLNIFQRYSAFHLEKPPIAGKHL